MIPFDDDEDGDFDIGETTQTERDLAPDSPGKDLEEKYAEPDESELLGNVGDVDEDTFTAFLASVVLTNVGVFAVSLGLMLWYFRGMQRVGGGLVVVGLLALLRTYQHYYEWKQSRDEDSENPDRTTAPAEGEDAQHDDVDSQPDHPNTEADDVDTEPDGHDADDTTETGSPQR